MKKTAPKKSGRKAPAKAIPSTAKRWKASEGTITLESATGPCTADTTEWMLAPRGGPVTWLIVNDCPHSHTVRVDFTAADPLKPCDREKEAPGKSRHKRINCIVKNTVKNGGYPYEVYVDGNIIDPELEVRGPLKAGERQPKPRPGTTKQKSAGTNPGPQKG